MAPRKKYRSRKYSKRRKKQSPDFFLLLIFLVGIFVLLSFIPAFLSVLNNTFLLGVLALSLLLAGLLFIALIVWYTNRGQKTDMRAFTAAHVQNMDGLFFERYMAVLMKSRGFHVRELGGTGDYGLDLIVKKEGVKYAVQLKRYSGNVGNKAVQEAVAGMIHYNCDQPMVITTAKAFTKAAQIHARETNCILIARPLLSKWIREFHKTGQSYHRYQFQKK